MSGTSEQKTMKAYVLKGIGQLEYTDVLLPSCGPGYVLVRVCAAGICGSDLPRIFETGTYHFPTIPGHEFAGIVVDACDEEGRRWIGKRVGIFPLIPCRECFVCREGQYEMCRNYDYLGSRRDGGFAEYAAVPVQNLMELPEAMTMEEAAMLEPASVSLHAVRRLTLHRSDTVALFGLGTIGLIITQWLRIRGITSVYAVGHNPGHGDLMKRTAREGYAYYNAVRRPAVAETGCTDLKPDDRSETAANHDPVSWIMEQTGGKGVSVAIDCAGTAESVTNCLNCVRPGGQLLLVGNPKGEMVFDQASYWKILRNQIRVTGTWNSSFDHHNGDDWHRVAAAAAQKELHLSELITHRLRFDELLHGLSIEKDHTEYYNKIMICASEGEESFGR